MDTNRLLDELKSLYSLKSDYAVAKFLGIRQSRITNYRKYGRQMDDETAVKVVGLLKKDPGLILIQLHATRTDCPAARRAFFKAASRLEHAN